MQGLFELVLAGLSGMLLVTAANLAGLARLVQVRNVLRVLAMAGFLFGMGAGLRALAFHAVSHGLDNVADYSFRLHYISWAFGAALGPVAARMLHSGVEAGVLNVGIFLVTVILSVFALTPAFVPFSSLYGMASAQQWTGTGLSGAEIADLLAIRWAFPSLVAFTAAASLASSAIFLVVTRRFGARMPRFIGQVMAIAYGAMGLLFFWMASLDIGVFWPELAPLVGILVTGAWSSGFLVINGATASLSERAIRRLRANLDSVSANALRDPLTGLFNRGFFFEAVHQAMEHLKRDGEPFAVAMLDLDDFKKVNDTYGHQVGDLVLQSVAKVVMRGLRPYDTAARYGGEEFVVVLRGVDLDSAVRIVERLRMGIQEQAYPLRGGGTVRVTATVGLLLVRETDRSLDEVMEGVDRAMYEGKRSGKNQVRIAD